MRVPRIGFLVLLSIVTGSFFATYADDNGTGGLKPCSELKKAPCAKAISASKGCVLIQNQSFDRCVGEVIVLHTANRSKLVKGESTDNWRSGKKDVLCAVRYECKEKPSGKGCTKGKSLGGVWAKEVYDGGECKAVVVEDDPLEADPQMF